MYLINLNIIDFNNIFFLHNIDLICNVYYIDKQKIY